MKWAILALAIALPLHADDDLIDADRPGIADGSHSVKREHFQIELGVQHDGYTLPALLRYGLTDAFELRLENDNGSAPFSIGFKDHVFERGTTSVGVIGRWFAVHRSYGDLRLASDISPNEHWSINPNIGVAIDRQRSKGATAALTLQYNFTQRLNVFIDGGAQRSQLQVDAGGAWIAGKDTQFDVSIFHTAHGAGPNVMWSVGVSRRF